MGAHLGGGDGGIVRSEDLEEVGLSDLGRHVAQEQRVLCGGWQRGRESNAILGSVGYKDRRTLGLRLTITFHQVSIQQVRIL